MGRIERYKYLYNIQKVLPAVYDDSLSYYELLDKIQHILKELSNFANELDDTDDALKKRITKLETDFQKFLESGFVDYYERQILEWIDNNLGYLFTHLIKNVFFGLTDDGYFCAYVPDSWSDIVFDTGAVFGRIDYGRLILKIDVDSPNVIDNTFH